MADKETLPIEEKITKNKDADMGILTEAIDKLDKEIFFTAAMAKSKTIAVHKKKLEVEMLPIYQEINKAISAGKYSVLLKITKDQRNFLTSKNFNVSCNSSSTNNGELFLSCNIYWN